MEYNKERKKERKK